MTDIATLTRAETIALADYEQVIERGLKTFVEVGTALSTIRDGQLYRGTHATFEAYAKDRWNLSRPRAYELMTAAEVVSGMPDTAAPITSARQATELAKVPEPERADVWAKTVEKTNGKPTAAAVREVSEQAALQRDARAVLTRALDLLVSPNRANGADDIWLKQLGPYDEEMTVLVKRSMEAISLLDRVVEEAGQ